MSRAEPRSEELGTRNSERGTEETSSSAFRVPHSEFRRHAPLTATLRLVGLLTLLSRVFGLARDMAMAAVFGNGAVMDAFSVAFRIPNLARRLFGEGALTAAFLPAFVRELEQAGRESAWRLATAVLAVLTVLLGGIVLAGELALGLIALFAQPGPEAQLLLGLTAVMLPYLLLICVASQLGAVLHALDHFTWPALLPVLLNVIWIAALAAAVRWIPSDVGQIYAISVAVVIAGGLQLVAPLPALYRLGFRFRRAGRTARPQVAQIGRAMIPVVLGLSITQLNTLADSLIAWGFSAPETRIEDRGSKIEDRDLRPSTFDSRSSYPLPAGTASALYFGQRLYQFPLGVFGVALGTVLFPLLTRHAERGEWDRLRGDLTLGLRLVVAIGVPASLGLLLMARPLTALFFQHGAFDAADAAQTAGIIGMYGLGVWAYCGQLILHRAFYAVGDRLTPLRIGLIAMAVNLALNLTLLWPLAGEGLALATALAAMVQVGLLAWALQQRLGGMDWRPVLSTTARAVAASAVMAAACLATLDQFDGGTRPMQRLSVVAAALAASITAFLLAAWWLRLEEVWLLLRRERHPKRP